MMNCETFRLQIDAYADETLSPSERATFEVHRAACPRCRKAAAQVCWLGDFLRSELPKLAAATPAEGVALRENVLGQLGLPVRGARARAEAGRRLRVWMPRLVGMGVVLTLALLAVLTFLAGDDRTVSAAEVVDRAWVTVAGHQGLSGVLYWEAEWSQRFPAGDQITHTFEMWFDFDNPGRYRITQRDADGQVFHEMVRDGIDHMWQLSRTIATDGRAWVQVDEIILSPDEMQELASWYVPSSPLRDDLGRFAEVLGDVELVGEIEIGGRPAYVLRGQLFGFGRPGQGSRIDPVTSTVQLVVDVETYWLLDRAERVPVVGGGGDIAAGFTQRTRHFEILAPEQVPPDAFNFVPPPDAQVRTVEGADVRPIAGYYAPSPDAIGLEEAAAVTSFTPVLPSDLPDDLRPRPYFRYQGPGRAGTFGIVYLGRPGRQVFLLEHEQVRLPGRATRLVTVGEKQGWLVPDPIDGRKFSLYLFEPQPPLGPDGRPWPRSVELQVWGLSLDEAVAMLASLEPYQ